MVMAARRAYSDVIRWIKDARPRRAGSRLALKLFRTVYAGSFLLLGTIGLLRPSRFGSPTSRPLRSMEWFALAALVVLVAGFALVRRGRIARSLHRLLEPFRYPLDHPSHDPAAGALESCPAPLRVRFALAWVWGPVAGLVLAAFLAASSAYFVVDAVLARFEIGWEQPILAALQALASLLVLRAIATRLSIWRLALSVHRAVTGGYV